MGARRGHLVRNFWLGVKRNENISSVKTAEDSMAKTGATVIFYRIGQQNGREASFSFPDR